MHLGLPTFFFSASSLTNFLGVFTGGCDLVVQSVLQKAPTDVAH